MKNFFEMLDGIWKFIKRHWKEVISFELGFLIGIFMMLS
jgi:hypothetical protein